ncbi:MAG: hypothetical protein WA880_08465 [Ornithinimicrobium sp.]
MDQTEVLDILDLLQGAGVRLGVSGGWGVDALVGQQTREHRDLDLLVDAHHVEECLSLLLLRGYAVETDWLPVRIELARGGLGWVDIHPVTFAIDGSGVQAGLDGASFDYPADCFTRGWLSDRAVPCLTAARQRVLHTGYDPQPQDLHDIRLLDALDT